MQCFGIKISDVGISFAKSVTQTSIYYKQVESPAGDFCKEFYEAILFHQGEMIGQMQDGDSQMSQTFKKIADKTQDLTSGEGAAKAASSFAVHDEL